LACGPFDYMERVGFMTFTAARHQGLIKVLASLFRMCGTLDHNVKLEYLWNKKGLLQACM